MDFDGVRTEVQSALMARDDISTGQIGTWINKVVRDICRDYNFSFMIDSQNISTVDGQRTYALPDGTGADLRYKVEIDTQLIDYLNNRQRFVKHTREDIEESGYYDDTTDKGNPLDYAIENRNLYVYPLPDHSLNNSSAWTMPFRYYGYLATLVNDADTNYLTDYNPYVLVYGALAEAFRYVYEENRATYYDQQYAKELQRLVQEEIQETSAEIDDGMRPTAGNTLGIDTRFRTRTGISQEYGYSII